MTEKKNEKPTRPSYLKDLALLFGIPTIIAILAALVVYVPSMFAHPKYDFLYYSCPEYRCNYRYSVDHDGQLVKQSTRDSVYEDDFTNTPPTLHYYDVEKDTTRTISFREARELSLDTSSKSPDGYSLGTESTRGGFLFWGSYDSEWYLKNGLAKKKVDLESYNNNYYEDDKFLGWVEK